MRNYLKDKTGAGQINTAMKVIIGVVIGALVLGGLYLIVAGDSGVVGKMDTEISAMMDYSQELRVERAYDEDSGQFYLRYSYDGKHWSNSEIPTRNQVLIMPERGCRKARGRSESMPPMEWSGLGGGGYE